MQENPGISRREVLKRGAALGGSLIWAVPTIQTIGMSAASAQDASPTCRNRYRVKWDPIEELDEFEPGDYALGSWSTGTFFCVTTGGELPSASTLTGLGLPGSLKVIAGTGAAAGYYGIELDLSGTDCTYNPDDGAQAKCASAGACPDGQPCEDAVWDAINQTLRFEPCYCNSTGKYHNVSHIEVILCCG